MTHFCAECGTKDWPIGGVHKARIRRGEPIWCSKRCRNAKEQRRFRERNIEIRLHLPRDIMDNVSAYAATKQLRRDQMIRAIIRAWDTGHTKSAA